MTHVPAQTARRLRTLALTLLATLPAFACADTGECGPTAACAAPRIDLAVDELQVVDAAGAWTDDVTGMPVLRAGGSARVDAVVRNRGDYATQPVRIVACVPVPEWDHACGSALAEASVPALAPGDEAAVSLTVPLGVNGLPLDSMVVMRAALTLPVADADAANDTLLVRALLAQPRIEGSVAHPDTIRAGDTIEIIARLGNRSRLAAAPADTIHYCIVEAGVYCHAFYDVAWAVTADAILPGGEYVDTVQVDVPVDFSYYADEAIVEPFFACLGDHGCARGGSTVTVLPDVHRACSATLLTVGVGVSGRTRTTTCNIRQMHAVDVFTFDAGAAGSLRVVLTNTELAGAEIAVLDVNGAVVASGGAPQLAFVLPVAGRYHVVVAEAGSFELMLESL